MDPAIKKVAIVIALALIVVLGLIVVTNSAASKEAPVATNEIEIKQTAEPVEEEIKTPETEEANAEEKPADEAEAGDVSKTNEAPEEENEAAQEEVMYEGALAGLSEEEIAKMALAEEQGSERTNTSGAEDSVD